ncbi:hypothetical protein HPP92_005676 [Vanilla planifolia]|uniref:Uncharacterized protein n=1 Tax=Vanilla planifolia TaxID=51239 RepID=A0A835VCE5_VANPL|nr:hypothetical protein HPP92_005676 [Vanilla planifolia]
MFPPCICPRAVYLSILQMKPITARPSVLTGEIKPEVSWDGIGALSSGLSLKLPNPRVGCSICFMHEPRERNSLLTQKLLLPKLNLGCYCIYQSKLVVFHVKKKVPLILNTKQVFFILARTTWLLSMS